MQFSQYPLLTDPYGFHYAKNNIMKTNKEKGCMQCSASTCFVEVLSEGYLCSDECEIAWYAYLDEVSG